MDTPAHVSGLLLCRAGDHRLAFSAHEVVAVETWQPNEAYPHARAAFALPADKGRVLISATGDAVGVDKIEVFQEPLPLLAAPAVLASTLGGSLSGFVEARSMLWPVLRVAEFSRYLSEGAR